MTRCRTLAPENYKYVFSSKLCPGNSEPNCTWNKSHAKVTTNLAALKDAGVRYPQWPCRDSGLCSRRSPETRELYACEQSISLTRLGGPPASGPKTPALVKDGCGAGDQ